MSNYNKALNAGGTLGEIIGRDVRSCLDKIAAIDARLSALEAAQKKPDAPTPEQREPGLYPIKAANGLYYVRRWARHGRWINQSGYSLVDESEPAWIGPRIPEQGE